MRVVFIALALLEATSLIAAPPGQRRYEDDFRGAISGLQHEINNSHLEIKVFEERLETLDATLDALTADMHSLKAVQKDKRQSVSLETDAKIGNLDLAAKGMSADIKALKGQLNETVAALSQFKSRLAALEKAAEVQNQNIDTLQATMRMLAESLQIKEGLKPTKFYVVKSGDALEKIARANQMTVDEIKELNGLTNVKIIVGQKLLVYDR